MTFLHDEPKTFAADALKGFSRWSAQFPSGPAAVVKRAAKLGASKVAPCRAGAKRLAV